MSLKKSLRMLAVGLAIAGCMFVIPSYLGTTDDACAGGGHCPHDCPHTTCVTPGCGDDGIMATSACTHAEFQGPIILGCSIGCRAVTCN